MTKKLNPYLLKVASHCICMLLLFSSLALEAKVDFTDYIEVKDFCKQYNYVLYIKFKEELLTLKSANDNINLVIGGDIAFSESRVYFLEKPVISYKGNIYLPLSFAKKLEPGYLARKKKKEDSNLKTNLSNRRINFIVIDPGHGGRDPGNVSKGTLEKDINLIISKRLYSILRKQLPGIKIYLTRNTDKFLSLEERANKAVDLNDLNYNGVFISIHANAAFNPKTKGVETFFYSSMKSNSNFAKTGKRFFVFDKLTSSLSKDAKTSKALSLLYDLAISKESKVFAEYVNEALYNSLKPHTLNRGIKSHKSYFVVKHNAIPAILVEIGFLTNRKELSNLKTKSYKAKVVNGLTKGIVSFVKTFNKNNGIF